MQCNILTYTNPNHILHHVHMVNKTHTQCTQCRYLIIQMQPTSDNNFAPPSENQCSQSKCKANLPVGYEYKSCEKCRNTSRLSMQKKQKREKVDEGPHQGGSGILFRDPRRG